MVRIDRIVTESRVDGPGLRNVVFFQGCPIGCAFCQNKRIWPAEGGTLVSAQKLARTLSQNGQNKVTISGGEPFAQPQALAELVHALEFYGVTDIIVYTGFTWELLMDPLVNPNFGYMRSILDYVSIVVDGPFIKALDDKFINYRGSRNQRPIDVNASLDSGAVVVLDWDATEMVITPEGEVVLPEGLAVEFEDLGILTSNRMCGQTIGF